VSQSKQSERDEWDWYGDWRGERVNCVNCVNCVDCEEHAVGGGEEKGNDEGDTDVEEKSRVSVEAGRHVV